MSNKNITVIPAKPTGFVQGLPGLTKKRKVAGYARVSTDKDEQQNSYEAQVDYYTGYIQRNLEWEFVEVYTDEYTPYGLNPKSPWIADLLGCSRAFLICLRMTSLLFRQFRSRYRTECCTLHIF